jgi:hypothetical protein
MHLIELRLQELELRHARDERLRINEHLQAIREAKRRAPAPKPVRRRLGESIVRLGHRVAGESYGSPALTG